MTPRHAPPHPPPPRGKLSAPLYHILYYLRFDMQHDYVCTKWILDPSGPPPPPTGPVPRGYIKIPNVFLQSSSTGLSPVKVSRFYLKWSRSNGVTLQTDVRTAGRTDGRGVSQYPIFFFEKRGENKYQQHTKTTTTNNKHDELCLLCPHYDINALWPRFD